MVSVENRACYTANSKTAEGFIKPASMVSEDLKGDEKVVRLLDSETTEESC